MFSLRRPPNQLIETFIEDSRLLPLSYAPVGLVRDIAVNAVQTTSIHRVAGRTESKTRRLFERSEVIGNGERDFEGARAALAAWSQFNVGWIELFPRGASIETGTGVAVLIRHLGFWSLNGCRVVYAIGNRHEGHEFGYAYGTLTNHAEIGEELFAVSLHPDSGKVVYRIRASSWPRVALARLGHPVARVLQARFRRDSCAAMRRAVRSI